MRHSAAECTICAVKAFALMSCFVYFRVVPEKHTMGMPYDNLLRESMLDIAKKIDRQSRIRGEVEYRGLSDRSLQYISVE